MYTSFQNHSDDTEHNRLFFQFNFAYLSLAELIVLCCKLHTTVSKPFKPETFVSKMDNEICCIDEECAAEGPQAAEDAREISDDLQPGVETPARGELPDAGECSTIERKPSDQIASPESTVRPKKETRMQDSRVEQTFTYSTPRLDEVTGTTGLALIGNPGSGKSTILNGAVNKAHFESGISVGSGLTRKIQGLQVGSMTLFDTPGIADFHYAKDAAAQLNELLSVDMNLKICFVVFLQSGRVRPQDAATIDLVLRAVGGDVSNSFGVIINKLEPSLCRKLQSNEDNSAVIVQTGLTGRYNTSHWMYLPKIETLVDADDSMLQTEDLSLFLGCLPVTRTMSTVVDDIDIETFSECEKENNKRIEELQELQRHELRKLEQDVHRDMEERQERILAARKFALSLQKISKNTDSSSRHSHPKPDSVQNIRNTKYGTIEPPSPPNEIVEAGTEGKLQASAIADNEAVMAKDVEKYQKANKELKRHLKHEKRVDDAMDLVTATSATAGVVMMNPVFLLLSAGMYLLKKRG